MQQQRSSKVLQSLLCLMIHLLRSSMIWMAVKPVKIQTKMNHQVTSMAPMICLCWQVLPKPKRDDLANDREDLRQRNKYCAPPLDRLVERLMDYLLMVMCCE